MQQFKQNSKQGVSDLVAGQGNDRTLVRQKIESTIFQTLALYLRHGQEKTLIMDTSKGGTYKMSHVVKCERRRHYINRGWLVVMNKKVSLIFWLPVENADSCIEEAVAPKASPNTL